MDLEAIPGVGAKTAAALRELDDPVATVESGDVAAIARAPGVNEARAARIARGAIRRRHGDNGRVLATDRAREVYREAIDLLRDRTVTDYAAKRLETFYPSASAARIAEAQSFATDAMARDPDPAVREALADCAPLVDPPTVRVATGVSRPPTPRRSLAPRLRSRSSRSRPSRTPAISPSSPGRTPP